MTRRDVRKDQGIACPRSHPRLCLAIGHVADKLPDVLVISKYCHRLGCVICTFDVCREQTGARTRTNPRVGPRARQYQGERWTVVALSSLYLAERHLIVHFLGLLLVLAITAFALRTASLLQGAPTAAVGAHRLSSKRQGGHHRRSGRFVVKDPLDLAHYIRIQFGDKLKAYRDVLSFAEAFFFFSL